MNNQTHITIKSWAEADRPREKLLEQGRRALTEAELMAILIGSGTRNESAVGLCRRILNDTKGNLNVLSRLSVNELCRYRGIGPAKAVAIVAALELGRRRKTHKEPERPLLNNSKQVYNHVRHLFHDLPHEEMWVLFLNRRCRLIDKQQFGKGGNDFTPVNIKEIIRRALECRAMSITMVHNHPSGSVSASIPDKLVTDKLRDAAALFNIVVNDHLILANGRYSSFLDDGIL